ncbi:hypothetical protein GCM10007901_17220 [Dyella acidisoli]|uniref:Uncharacterized protein n=1 Tax=Dyella acidisoli TaxID=1867834 RepID=A0ABQ5XM51_9GAMM|nr:hypothetical protein GCM10007901_17220 [Dyella acidisoli]
MIGKITDERVFEQAPNDPSTPSLGFGGTDKASDDVKARAVGRKRNTYGMALGDVLLQPGQTVEGAIRENLTAAFQQAGYQVKGEGDAGSSPIMVDVHIKQFWAWFTPGFWVVTLSDNIATDLVFNGIEAPVVVSTHVEDKHAAATEDDWMQIVDKGLDAYRAEVLHRMQGSDGAHIATIAANAPLASPSVKPASMPASDVNQATVLSHQSVAEAATVPGPVAPASSQTSPVRTVSAIEVAAQKPTPVTETKPEEATPSAPPITAATGPASVTVASQNESAATAAIAPMAQSVATQLGCGAIQANGATTFVASCGTYSVLIDCDGSQCRPMHTLNVKHDE